ncbi:50S ribosomal protein L25/general stress protein Ctc [Sphingomonas radiodurans]|uniref:50S ribosomal protein L25/general stress protein Ctc n=1 Tax=Sphingomonas radiodurans TaxID=2890321 RepID=UPI001E427190|nr:50S ribosomal protein L25/general stress protein Ctc [Sphingomonas radiodurans]WBH16782.1 50S ribosomal protein L25/general stress protein Ctc [Sphingomonas radiodurans]
MSDQLTLAAETRDRVGKGASRALRRDGRVPAVIYGQNKNPASIHLEEKALVKALSTGHFMNTVVMVNGERTLPKDVHFHPVSDRPVHVDFLRISAHATVTVAVPVVFVDEEEAPGLTKGGVLNVVRHELELICDASEIPSEIKISLAGRDIGDSIHISDVTLPQGTESAIEDRDFTIATLIAPSAMKAEAQEQFEEEAALAEAASAEAAAEAEAEAAEDEAAAEGDDEEKTGE